MKKTKISVIILLVAVLALSLMFAACDLVPKHNHAYGTDYKFDENNHWRECSCGSKADNVAHEFSDWVTDLPATDTLEGSKHAECTVCGYKTTAVIPVLSPDHSHTAMEKWFSDEANHWHECGRGEVMDRAAHTPSDWIVDVAATSENAGSKHTECTLCHRKLQTEEIPVLTKEERFVDFYAINDFHGAVDRISSVCGFLRQQRNNNANSVIINSGDMFQGSMESNSNYGNLLSDCMDELGFDSFTFGNHEFDWGLDNLKKLAAQSSTPFLGSNIYRWNAATKTWGEFADDLAQEYAVKTLDNGLKVGIIGVIGKDQITSISSQLVQTIGFKNPSEIIPALSDKLKKQLGCDVVVVSAHTGQETFLNDSEFDITKYCDAVFCAHTHRNETATRGGVPFIQGGSKGNYVSHVKLSVAGGKVTLKTYENLSHQSNWPNMLTVDTLVDNSNAQIRDEANRVLTTITKNASKSGEIPRMVCNAIADYAAANYPQYPISLAMTNVARNDLHAGNVTYSNLYEALPFDNTVYIAKVSGKDLISEVNYGNYIWRVSGEAVENSDNAYYYIAIIDYLLYHQNSNRNYNYFPSAFTSGFDPVPLEKQGYAAGTYNYRFITRDWILAQSGNTLDLSRYNGNNDNTNVSLLTQKVNLVAPTQPDEQPSHAGTLGDPLTVTEAVLIASQNTDSNTAPIYYIKGTVAAMTNASLANNTGDMSNFYISDGNSEILVYYLKKFQGATKEQNWSSTGELKQGDEIVVCAKLYTYVGKNGSQKPEVYSGYCVTVNGQDPQTL